VKIMGAIQTEILTELLHSRFNVKARFDDPIVLYKGCGFCFTQFLHKRGTPIPGTNVLWV